MAIKFGPAGLGPVKTAFEFLEEYHKLGLEACEISFTYQIYIKPEDAKRIGKKAKELGISLSVHAPYFINLNSEEKAKREASKKRILDCCRIGELLGAKVVVAHPGYYGNKAPKSSVSKPSDYGENKEGAYENIKKGVLEILEEIKRQGWKINLALETMGKVNVFGSVEEISHLVKETGCSFCIDFAHVLARDKKIDYEKIGRLFPQKEWHAHFSGIIYGDKGERSHRKTEPQEWRDFLKNLPRDKNITIINESPDMINDSLDGRLIWKSLAN